MSMHIYIAADGGRGEEVGSFSSSIYIGLRGNPEPFTPYIYIYVCVCVCV